MTLTPADVAGGLALSTAAGWNQTREDWQLFIGHGDVVG
ncbi:MAG: GNAT family N-acetyltransferase, partial [Rubrivivax sp.]